MTTEFQAPEQVQRFIFDKRPVRGHWVGIGEGWRKLREFRDYSPPFRSCSDRRYAHRCCWRLP